MLTYEEARQFVKEATKRGSILGLDNMRALMKELHNVQNTTPTIHIAGTNGKGSVGAYLSQMLQEAGLNVGRYCSPAVFDELECWQINARNITKEEYADCMSQVKNACDIVASKGYEPTAFEIETAMAFVFFSKVTPDILLLETGLGGETDATNVVDNPLACVFTTISFDHMQFLGSTLTEIASVKAGIMKPGAHIVWATQTDEVEAVLMRKFEEVQAIGNQMGLPTTCDKVDNTALHFVSEEAGKLCFSYQGKNYITHLSGIYQMKNAALAMCVFGFVCQKFHIQQTDIEACKLHGINKAVWPGRFEVLGTHPLFVIDGAHNEDAARLLAQTVENCFTNQPLTYIIGVLADKERKKMLKLMLPYAQKVYTITPPNLRGLDGKKLAEEVYEICSEQEIGTGDAINTTCRCLEKTIYCENIEDAMEQAITYAKKNTTPILAFGSLSYLGELKKIYMQKFPK